MLDLKSGKEIVFIILLAMVVALLLAFLSAWKFLRFLTYPVAILCSLWILVQALESAANLDIENLYWPWYVGFTLFTATPLVIVWFIGKLSLRWRTREERKLHGGSVTSLRVKSNHVKYSEYEWIADIALSSKFLQASLPIRFPSGKHR